MEKLALKTYLKNKEVELNQIIIKKLSETKEDASNEMSQLEIIKTIINICESRNKY